MQSLKIKDGHIKEYIIDDTGILIKHYANKMLPTEETWPFENIKRDTVFYANRSPLFLIVSGMALIFCLFALTDSSEPTNNYHYLTAAVLMAASVTGIFMYFRVHTNIYFLKTFSGKFIRFRVKNNEDNISAFITAVLKKRDEYINMKYGTPSAFLSYDGQYSNFQIMLKEKMINQEQYLQKIEKLNTLFEQRQPGQVFQQFSSN